VASYWDKKESNWLQVGGGKGKLRKRLIRKVITPKISRDGKKGQGEPINTSASRIITGAWREKDIARKISEELNAGNGIPSSLD